MALHFEHREYSDRIARVTSALAAQNLDGLLMFHQESMYYLTGYDTFGFCFFQCLYLDGDGNVSLLTRAPDLRQAQQTSIIEDIRIWTDEAGAKPAEQLKDMLASLDVKGKRLGIETNSYGLTHFNGKAVEAALDGFCHLTEVSDLVSVIRCVKSPALNLNMYAGLVSLLTRRWMRGWRKRGPGPMKAIFWPPNMRQFLPGAGIIPAMNLLSDRGAMPCCVATNPGGGCLMSVIS